MRPVPPGSTKSCGVASGFKQAQQLRIAGNREHDGRDHGQQQMHDRPGQRDEQMNLRLIGHARRNQPADRAEHDRVDFSADANRGERMPHFVQRNAHEQNADHQQACAHQLGIGQRKRQRQAAPRAERKCADRPRRPTNGPSSNSSAGQSNRACDVSNGQKK